MMFLVPAITQKAMAFLVARADGKCGTTPCHLFGGGYFLVGGKWVDKPTPGGAVVTWSAHRTLPFTPGVPILRGYPKIS
jgi:hypothetical protein